jgi:hypothetical protein
MDPVAQDNPIGVGPVAQQAEGQKQGDHEVRQAAPARTRGAPFRGLIQKGPKHDQHYQHHYQRRHHRPRQVMAQLVHR